MEGCQSGLMGRFRKPLLERVSSVRISPPPLLKFYSHRYSNITSQGYKEEKIGIRVGEEIGHLPNFFVVDNINFIPHLSLWHMKIQGKVVNNIAQELKKIVKGQKAIKIISSGFRASGKYQGCLDIPIEKDEDLIYFRQRVFQKIYNYKTGAMPQFASFLGIKYSKMELKEIKLYGKRLGFYPHFTLGWLKNEADVARVIKRMKNLKFSFAAKEIYMCEVNKWWQVKRVIKKIDF